MPERFTPLVLNPTFRAFTAELSPVSAAMSNMIYMSRVWVKFIEPGLLAVRALPHLSLEALADVDAAVENLSCLLSAEAKKKDNPPGVLKLRI